MLGTYLTVGSSKSSRSRDSLDHVIHFALSEPAWRGYINTLTRNYT
jgi:hypothetical protein